MAEVVSQAGRLNDIGVDLEWGIGTRVSN